MNAPAFVPPAWPLLLTRDQVIAYLGGDMDARTLMKILPVHPLDIGANKVRYSRSDIDAWAQTLKPRLPKGSIDNSVADEPMMDPVSETDESRRQDAVDRARERATRGRSWKKTG